MARYHASPPRGPPPPQQEPTDPSLVLDGRTQRVSERQQFGRRLDPPTCRDAHIALRRGRKLVGMQGDRHERPLVHRKREGRSDKTHRGQEVVHARREREDRKLAHRYEACFGGVVAGCQSATRHLPGEIDQREVPSGGLARTDAFAHPNDFTHQDVEAGLLLGFPNDRLPPRLPPPHLPAGYRPRSGVGAATPSDQQERPLLEDHDPNPRHWVVSRHHGDTSRCAEPKNRQPRTSSSPGGGRGGHGHRNGKRRLPEARPSPWSAGPPRLRPPWPPTP